MGKKNKTSTLAQLKKRSYHKNFDTIISDLKRMLAISAPIERACRYAGISIDTYYRWLKESEEFREIMEKAQDSLFVASYDAVASAIENEKDVDIAIKFLERREKKLWSLRQEITGKDGEDINTTIIVTDIRDLDDKPNKKKK